MLTLLFDIDGTLVRAGGAGSKAMRRTMAEMFAVNDLPDVVMHGRTDHGIVSDFFAGTSLDVDDHRTDFCQRYCELLVESLPECGGSVLPGVRELVAHLAERDDVALGLLTGNMNLAAQIKLQHFQLDRYFGFGGYGDHHANRNDVADMARSAAQKHLQDRYVEDRVWVIGDTVNDVTCARSVDARVVAVETGGGTPDELRDSGPDIQYSTLPTPDQFMIDLLSFAQSANA